MSQTSLSLVSLVGVGLLSTVYLGEKKFVVQTRFLSSPVSWWVSLY